MGVEEDLDFDVPRAGQIFLDQDLIVAEGSRRLPLRACYRGVQVGRAFHDAHALTATAGRGFDQYRKSDAVRGFGQDRWILIFPVIAGDQWDARFLHQAFRR